VAQGEDYIRAKYQSYFLIRLTHEQYSRNFLKKIIRIMI
jgi:hypothetical protein